MFFDVSVVSELVVLRLIMCRLCLLRLFFVSVLLVMSCRLVLWKIDMWWFFRFLIEWIVELGGIVILMFECMFVVSSRCVLILFECVSMVGRLFWYVKLSVLLVIVLLMVGFVFLKNSYCILMLLVVNFFLMSCCNCMVVVFDLLKVGGLLVFCWVMLICRVVGLLVCVVVVGNVMRDVISSDCSRCSGSMELMDLGCWGMRLGCSLLGYFW